MIQAAPTSISATTSSPPSRKKPSAIEGMKIDRMFFEKFEERVRENDFIARQRRGRSVGPRHRLREQGGFRQAQEFYSLEKLRKAAGVDRRLTLREILEKIFGLIPRFKSKDDLLEEEFSKFVADYKPEEAEAIPAIKTYFKAYATSDAIRHIIDTRNSPISPQPVFSTQRFQGRPCEIPHARSRIHQGLRLPEPVRRLKDIHARHRHQTPHRHRPRHPRRQSPRPQVPGRADHHRPDLQVHG